MGYLIQLSAHIDNPNEGLVKRMSEIFADEEHDLAYISSKTDVSRKYYYQVIENLKQYGDFHPRYYDFDNEYSEESADRIFKSDIIYLSGGDTTYFLESLRRGNALKKLKDYYEDGGIIIGLSAGAILMADSIESIKVDRRCEMHADATAAIGVVKHDFVPHWNEADVRLDRMLEYSKDNGRLVFLCEDGNGIIVDSKHNAVEIYGIKYSISNGQLVEIQ